MKILIGQVRSLKGITLKELAALTGISKSSLNYYETEKIYPRIDQLEKIAIALGIKITDLFDSKYK